MVNPKDYMIEPGVKTDLNKADTAGTGEYKSKVEAKQDLKKNIKKMNELQSKLYAFDKYSLLLIFQAMDAAGKDSTIKHVMSGLNPQGTQVFSFKQPSAEELNHDFLWRNHKALPERGRIGIFNRSYYEEVLVVRVHDLLKTQKIPSKLLDKDVWEKRYRAINDFEKYLYENGTIILKFFLHVSKEEQKRRFIRRIDKSSKNWKFSGSDLKERAYWDEYQKCYAEAISATSKKHAPWFVIPADHKWFMRLAVSSVITESMKSLKLEYPVLGKEQLKTLAECREKLMSE